MRVGEFGLDSSYYWVLGWARSECGAPVQVSGRARGFGAGLCPLGAVEAVEFDGGVDPFVDEVAQLAVVGDLGLDGGEVLRADVLGAAAVVAAVAELVVWAVLLQRVCLAATARGAAHVVSLGQGPWPQVS